MKPSMQLAAIYDFQSFQSIPNSESLTATKSPQSTSSQVDELRAILQEKDENELKGEIRLAVVPTVNSFKFVMTN